MPKQRTGDLKATSQLQIERIGRTNIADVSAGLCDLDWNVRARQVPPDFWPWLYFRNPAGDAVAIVAFDGQRPVGRFERIPVRVAVDSQTQTADLLQGLTLAPEFRQWTHLRRLLAAAIRAESVEKPVFSFGFSTSAAARLHASIGQPVLGRVPVFAVVLNGTAMLRGRKFPSPVSAIAGPLSGALFRWRTRPHEGHIEVSETNEFTGGIEELRPLPVPPTAVFVLKDPAYLNWRYVERPGACYHRLIAWKGRQPAGFLVWRANEINRDGYILELAARNDDPATFDALLHAAREQMQSAGLGLVTASFPRAGAAAHALLRAGFGSWATLWKNMSLVVVPRQQGRQTELSLTAWNYSLGDWLYH